MKALRLAMAQINPTVGDLGGNRDKVLRYMDMARDMRADVVAFPEMCITGYPPEDLLLKPRFIRDNLTILHEIKGKTQDIAAIVGFVDMQDDIYNACAMLCDGNIVDVYHKVLLPNYGVFDEVRYFRAGTRLPVYDICSTLVGVNICEDIWYPDGPAHRQGLYGAELIININASPYGINKTRFRETMLCARASDNVIILAYLNTVGGQDELVFDGNSLVIGPTGEVIRRGAQFAEDFIVIDLDIESVFLSRLQDPRRRNRYQAPDNGNMRRVFVCNQRDSAKPPLQEATPVIPAPFMGGSKQEQVYAALRLGTSDYVRKNGFSSVLIGLSGGIDSSIVATLAVDAIGKEHVKGVFMPSPYTSEESRQDVYELAANLGINVIEIPISDIFAVYLKQLELSFKDRGVDTTEENLQARIRGNILMALSNKFGSLVLTTGNKSEMSVGYATLYGDMAGGFAVIKDVPKTLVYELCRRRNAASATPLIPQRVLVKEPTAELRHSQKDTDSLPPYDLLDPVLAAYVEKEMSYEEIIALGNDETTTRNVLKMVDNSEYKRRQSPPGIKITNRAFGKDRRFPITNGYKGY
ncbi:MAG: NAD+ synthase [Magnetococcales bacterium]|nr:NAD+ synthase [Nitrospirota bacterium]